MTDAAGDCLVASAERDGQLIVAVLYNDPKRWQDVKTWMDYGFAAAKVEKNIRRHWQQNLLFTNL